MLPRSRFPLLDNPGRLRNCSRKLHARCRILGRPGRAAPGITGGRPVSPVARALGTCGRGQCQGGQHASALSVQRAVGDPMRVLLLRRIHPTHRQALKGQLASQVGCRELQNTSFLERDSGFASSGRTITPSQRNGLRCGAGPAWLVKRRARWLSTANQLGKPGWMSRPHAIPASLPNRPKSLQPIGQDIEEARWNQRSARLLLSAQLSLQRVSCRCVWCDSLAS